MLMKSDDERVSSYVPKINNHDLLLNKAMRETIPEDMLAVYRIYTDDWDEFSTIIAPIELVKEYLKHSVIPEHVRASKSDHVVYLTDDEFFEFDHTRFLSDKYQYIGISSDDVALNYYISRITPNDNDTPLLKLVKRVLDGTVHLIDSDSHKSYLTQIYSRIRRTSRSKEDKASIYNSFKLLESFAESVEITAYIRDDKGKLKAIKEKIF